MTTAEQQQYSSTDAEFEASRDLNPESVAQATVPGPQRDGAPDVAQHSSPLTGEPSLSLSDISSRIDAMSGWASNTQSQIRGLIAAQQVLENRLATLNELQDQVGLLASHLADQQMAATPQSVDGALGYQPTPEQQAQLFAALAEWQVTARPLQKGQEANITTRTGGTVSYRYADIASVSEIARSAGAVGLCHFHREIVLAGQSFIRTYLLHKAGGWISCDIPLLTKENTMISSLQQWASACTMARRYGLFMVLGIAAGDEDDDGMNSDGPRSRTQVAPQNAVQTAPGLQAAPGRTVRTTRSQ